MSGSSSSQFRRFRLDAAPSAARALALSVLAVTVWSGCHAQPDEPGTMPPAPKSAPAARKAPASVPMAGCDKEADPVLAATFTDDFQRSDLGNDWRSTDPGAYYLRGGQVCTTRPRNHPLWLKRKLPTNVRVAFDARPGTPNADVKAELFGDGCSMDVEGREYTATSYVAVLGAHNNSENWLARMNEHGADLHRTKLVAGASSAAESKLAQNQTYHVELARTDGKTIEVLVDGVKVHSFEDNQPLDGAGHDHFAFNGWENGVCFDKLVVTPLP